MANRQRQRIDQAIIDKQVAELYAQKLTQTEIAKRLGVSQPSVSLACKRNKERDLRDAALVRRDWRHEIQQSVMADIERLTEIANDIWNELHPENPMLAIKGKPALAFREQYAKVLDRKFKGYSVLADVLGLKSLALNVQHDLPPNMREFVEAVKAMNGDRAKVTFALLDELEHDDAARVN